MTHLKIIKNYATRDPSIRNIRGRLGIAEEVESATAGFLTPFVLSFGPPPAEAPGTPNPIGSPSRAADAS